MTYRPGIGASVVEVRCETDFVARNGVFCDLVEQVGKSALFCFARPSLGVSGGVISTVGANDILDMPLVTSGSSSGGAGVNTGKDEDERQVLVRDALMESVGKLGENIQMKRGGLVAHASSISSNHGGPMTHLAYGVHGALPRTPTNAGHAHAHQQSKEASDVKVVLGKIACLVILETTDATSLADLDPLGSNLAQHIMGMSPTSVPALLAQPFLFDSEKTVEQVLSGQSVRVRQFARVECGAEDVILCSSEAEEMAAETEKEGKLKATA